MIYIYYLTSYDNINIKLLFRCEEISEAGYDLSFHCMNCFGIYTYVFVKFVSYKTIAKPLDESDYRHIY